MVTMSVPHQICTMGLRLVVSNTVAAPHEDHHQTSSRTCLNQTTCPSKYAIFGISKPREWWNPNYHIKCIIQLYIICVINKRLYHYLIDNVDVLEDATGALHFVAMMLVAPENIFTNNYM